MPYTVYALSHPTTGEVFYIGVTLNLQKRMAQHTYSYAQSNVKRYGLENITSKDYYLINTRIDPNVSAIEVFEGSAEYALNREAFWIVLFEGYGFPLMNEQQSSLLKNRHDHGISFSEKKDTVSIAA
jgi:hypothetical protein